MAVRHKIRVDSLGGFSTDAPSGRLWYALCHCGWTPRAPYTDAYHGRPAWGDALALGLAHLRRTA